MARNNDAFIFSDNIKDWMSSSDEREQKRKQYREDHRRRKEKSGNNNSGYKTLSSMNDQMRA